MVFMILVGATIFSGISRLWGDELIKHLFDSMPGGQFTAMLVVMLVIFLLGFILDFIEITFVVVPIVRPVLFAMGIDPVVGHHDCCQPADFVSHPTLWFHVVLSSWRRAPEVSTRNIYRGVVPFIGIQSLCWLLLALVPELATWLPQNRCINKINSGTRFDGYFL